MDMDTYVSRERVRAGQVRKANTEIVTSAGRVPIPQYSYLVEFTRQNELGQDYVHTEVLTMDEFNAKYQRLDWRDEDRKEARDEGYEDGYNDGWNACATAKDTANTIVTESKNNPTTLPGTETTTPSDLPPVGDKLEDLGPMSSRNDTSTLDSTHGEDTDDTGSGDRDRTGTTAGGHSDSGEGEDGSSDARGSESTGLSDAHPRES